MRIRAAVTTYRAKRPEQCVQFSDSYLSSSGRTGTIGALRLNPKIGVQ